MRANGCTRHAALVGAPVRTTSPRVPVKVGRRMADGAALRMISIDLG